jgi:hypothetical protein
MRLPLNWPKSANVSQLWKSAPHHAARKAIRVKKAILARKAQKEKEAIRVPKVYKRRKEKEATPAAGAFLVLKAREACPAHKVFRDLQGQRVILQIRDASNSLRPASQNWRSASLRQASDLKSSRMPQCPLRGWVKPLASGRSKFSTVAKRLVIPAKANQRRSLAEVQLLNVSK